MKVTALSAEGTISYKWYYLNENDNEVIIDGATNNTYTITANDDTHKKYLCRVTNTIGNDGENVDVNFNVNIDTKLSASIVPSTDVKVPYNETKTLTADTSSLASNITYQWYYMAADATEGTAIADATENTYILPGDTTLKYSYYCVVSDGINTFKTKSVYPILDSGLKAFAKKNHMEVYYGNTVNLEVEATSKKSDIKYEWYNMCNLNYETYTYDLELIKGVNTSTYNFIAGRTSSEYILCKVSDGIMTKEIYFDISYYGKTKDINEGFTASLEYTSVVEDGTAKKPIVTVRSDEKTLEIDRHYTVEYKNNVKPGTATVIIKGIGLYEGEITKTFTITAKPVQPAKPSTISISNATIKLAKKGYVYDGKAKKPKVTVVLNGKTLVNGTDYTVTYAENKQIGKATVIVTGKGKYSGTIKTTFNINIKVGKTYTVGAYKYKVTSKSEVAFAGLKKANTKNVVIAGTVKIGGKKFKITSIVNNALKKKTKVKSVAIGANVKKIGKNAFSGCKNLKTITIKTTKLKSVGKNAFKGINSKAKIKVPKKKYNAYTKLLKGKGQPKKVKITK
ncbi:MAG: hypothetical protein E7270_09270 [Lachnospiraceae bacterium]|nr:hypothetical protein [Lachnospiraceae bacterium]